ncbi:MAG: T9SS type A sorting domain-containing protein [Calditrichaeota bacterium]|nr:T9SS type A sorting domain-containing protein [Calditrichota bacterium]
MFVRMLIIVIFALSNSYTAVWSAENQMLQSPQVQLFYDEDGRGPLRDPGQDWIAYDNGEPAGLIVGRSYWSKVIFLPLENFQLQAFSILPLNQGPNFDESCRVRVYSEDQENHDLDEMLIEVEIERLNEFGENAEHIIELDEDDYIEFEANETFAIMYDAPGGPYNPGQEGAGWWNVYDGANNGRRSSYSIVEDFGDDPALEHDDWIDLNGDLLIRANGEYLEGFIDLEITELYNAEEIWMDLPGTEHTFIVDIVNNGVDIENYEVSFNVFDADGNEIWDHLQEVDGLGEGDEESVECDEVWELPEEIGNYTAVALVIVDDDADDENDFAELDQSVFDPINEPEAWLSYTDGSFESTTAWNEDSGWAAAFHHPGGDCPPLGLTSFRVAIFSEERIRCDFAVHILNLEQQSITSVWEGSANTDGNEISWIEIEPEFEDDVAITEGEAFTVTYFFADGTRFPADDSPPFAGTNGVMPYAMLNTQDDGQNYAFANSGDYPIEVQLVPTDWVPDGAHLRVSPEIIDFGMGLQQNREYVIEAVFSSFGNEPVDVHSIRIPMSALEYISVEPVNNFEIAPGEEEIVVITFSTNEEVELDTQFLITYNGDDPRILWPCRASTEEPNDFERRVLLEDFTNAGCPPCAQFAPQLQAALEDLGDSVVPLGYHVWWPGEDPWYDENPATARWMVEYYGVRGVPAIFIDGQVFAGRNRDAVVNAVEARERTRSPFEITLEGEISDGELHVTAEVMSVADMDDMFLRVALTEGHENFRGANGLADHYDAMVRMLPNANGQEFNIAEGETVDFELELDMGRVGWHDLDIENLFLSAWVQGPDREIHQSVRTGIQEGGEEPEIAHFDDFTVTDANHSNIIQELTFEEEGVPSGWEIGVFTPDGILAGGVIWDAENRSGLAAWADDANTEDVVEGFVAGQRMSYRVWDNETETEYPGIPNFLQGNNEWQVNGFTALTLAASGARELLVNFLEGWNMISINVLPSEEFFAENEARGPDVILMTEQLRFDEDNHNVLIFKDELGRFYSPDWNFCNIPFWNLTQGYLVSMVEEMETVWSGMPISHDADIPIEEGWNMIGYFPDYELSAAAPDFDVLAPIIDHVIIAKDYLGRFISTAWEFSNMSPWRETQGYQVNVDEDVVLNYPGPNGELAALIPVDIPNNHWTEPVISDNNMSLLITGFNNSKVRVGDQIAAISLTGQVVGKGDVKLNGVCGIAVWGNDQSTESIEGLMDGQTFHLCAFNAESNEDIALQPSVIHEGPGLIYETNGFSVLSLDPSVATPDKFYLTEAYPNPFNSTTSVSFGIPEATQVSVRVFDISGRLIATLVDGEIIGGHHSTIWHAADVTSGVYVIMLKSSEIQTSRKVMLMR